MPSVSACSSLYNARSWSGMHPLVTETMNARKTSLSLNTMLVRGLVLANGYFTVHGANGLHFVMPALAVALQVPSTVTMFVVVQQTVPVATKVTVWPGAIEAIGLPATMPNRSSLTITSV